MVLLLGNLHLVLTLNTGPHGIPQGLRKGSLHNNEQIILPSVTQVFPCVMLLMGNTNPSEAVRVCDVHGPQHQEKRQVLSHEKTSYFQLYWPFNRGPYCGLF